MIQPLTGAARDLSDMFFVLICRNDCRGLRSYIRFCHIERSRAISVLKPELPRLRFARNANDCKRTRGDSLLVTGAPPDESRPRDTSCEPADRRRRKENPFD